MQYTVQKKEKLLILDIFIFDRNGKWSSATGPCSVFLYMLSKLYRCLYVLQITIGYIANGFSFSLSLAFGTIMVHRSKNLNKLLIKEGGTTICFLLQWFIVTSAYKCQLMSRSPQDIHETGIKSMKLATLKISFHEKTCFLMLPGSAFFPNMIISNHPKDICYNALSANIQKWVFFIK